MGDGGGKCSDKALSKDQMEGSASGCFEKALSEGNIGGQRHNEKATSQSPMGGKLLEEEQHEDIEWLSALSHSHLDMLISLKELAILRAKNAGCAEAAEKFDLKMLRELGAILMEYLKERIQNARIFPDSCEGFELLSGSQFVAQKHQKDLCQVAPEENIKSSSRPTRKRPLEGDMELQSCRKPQAEDSSG